MSRHRFIARTFPLALVVVALATLLAACGAGSSSTSSSGGSSSGGGNLPTVTSDTCTNDLSLAQASAIVGEVTKVTAVVTTYSNAVNCSYIATNGAPNLLMNIIISANARADYDTIQHAYQHLMPLSGYGDAATVGYQDHFPVYTLLMVKGNTYVFIQTTDLDLNSSLAKVKAVAQAILPKL